MKRPLNYRHKIDLTKRDHNSTSTKENYSNDRGNKGKPTQACKRETLRANNDDIPGDRFKLCETTLSPRRDRDRTREKEKERQREREREKERKDGGGRWRSRVRDIRCELNACLTLFVRATAGAIGVNRKK